MYPNPSIPGTPTNLNSPALYTPILRLHAPQSLTSIPPTRSSKHLRSPAPQFPGSVHPIPIIPCTQILSASQYWGIHSNEHVAACILVPKLCTTQFPISIHLNAAAAPNTPIPRLSAPQSWASLHPNPRAPCTSVSKFYAPQSCASIPQLCTPQSPGSLHPHSPSFVPPTPTSLHPTLPSLCTQSHSSLHTNSLCTPTSHFCALQSRCSLHPAPPPPFPQPRGCAHPDFLAPRTSLCNSSLPPYSPCAPVPKLHVT